MEIPTHAMGEVGENTKEEASNKIVITCKYVHLFRKPNGL